MSFSKNELPLLSHHPPLTCIKETHSPFDFFKLYIDFIDKNFSNLQTVTFYVSDYIYEILKDYAFFEKIKYSENSHSLLFPKFFLNSSFTIYVRIKDFDPLHEVTSSIASHVHVQLIYTNNTFNDYAAVFFQKFVSQYFFEIFWIFFLQNDLEWDDFLTLSKKL